MEDLRNYLLGVLIEVTAHFVIRAIEEMPRRKGDAKHMRQG